MAYPVRKFEYAKIIRAVDGDTCEIEVDLGFSVKVKHTFRLYGINTPERGKPGYQEATDYLAGYVGETVLIAVTKLDKYGRYLVDIFADGVNVNRRMVDLGLAVEYMI
jgi:micrococcal nuclease